MSKLDIETLRYQANQNLKRLAEEKHRIKPEKEAKKPKRQEPTADELETGQMIEELEGLQKLERKIARRAASNKGFEGSDYNRGMWEEVDHRIEVLQKELKSYDDREYRRLKRLWKRYCKKGVTRL